MQILESTRSTCYIQRVTSCVKARKCHTFLRNELLQKRLSKYAINSSRKKLEQGLLQLDAKVISLVRRGYIFCDGFP